MELPVMVFMLTDGKLQMKKIIPLFFNVKENLILSPGEGFSVGLTGAVLSKVIGPLDVNLSVIFQFNPFLVNPVTWSSVFIPTV